MTTGLSNNLLSSYSDEVKVGFLGKALILLSAGRSQITQRIKTSYTSCITAMDTEKKWRNQSHQLENLQPGERKSYGALLDTQGQQPIVIFEGPNYLRVDEGSRPEIVESISEARLVLEVENQKIKLFQVEDDTEVTEKMTNEEVIIEGREYLIKVFPKKTQTLRTTLRESDHAISNS